jgi:denticleless
MALSTRPALATRTNTLHAFGVPQRKLTSFLSNPPSDQKPKRRRETEDKRPLSKRLKVAEPSESESEETEGEFEDDKDAFMEDVSVAHARSRLSMPFNVLNRQIMSIGPRRHARMSLLIRIFILLITCFLVSTLPILQSFVSSNKADVFKCQSMGDDTYMTPPYACSYTHRKISAGALLTC